MGGDVGEVLGEVLGEVFEQHLPFRYPCVYRLSRRKGEVGRCFYECGYRVYILPNPRSCRTADFIFEKKGILGLYDLKTVYGKGSVETQLLDSIGQTNRVILNMLSDYNARLLASDIKAYFETNQDALEVLIFKGKKVLSVNRIQVQSSDFNRVFRKRYEK